jgi:hypothetical protein
VLARIDLLALFLALELALGTLLYLALSPIATRSDPRHPRLHRRRVAAWSGSTRALRRALPWALAVAVAAALIRLRATAEPLPQLGASPTRQVGLALAIALSLASCYVLLHAGLRESRGELRGARVEVGLAGRVLFLGVLAIEVLVFSGLIYDASLRRASVAGSPATGLALTGSLLVLGLAAFVGLVAGLAGKPRPSGPFAVVLFLAGLLGLLSAGAAPGAVR